MKEISFPICLFPSILSLELVLAGKEWAEEMKTRVPGTVHCVILKLHASLYIRPIPTSHEHAVRLDGVECTIRWDCNGLLHI